MPIHLALIADSPLPEPTLDAWREFCELTAGLTGEPATFWRIRPGSEFGYELTAALRDSPDAAVDRPGAEGPDQTMSSAPFVWRADGRPDWRAMWGDFCGLALYGGPPHRGPESPLHAGEGAHPAASIVDAIAETQRGIWETTGLESELARPGWLGVACESRRMAAWMCAAIILENVDALCEGEQLLVPAEEHFTLDNEVKSIITVVAKTHHYWTDHVRRVR